MQFNNQNDNLFDQDPDYFGDNNINSDLDSESKSKYDLLNELIGLPVSIKKIH